MFGQFIRILLHFLQLKVHFLETFYYLLRGSPPISGGLRESVVLYLHNLRQLRNQKEPKLKLDILLGDKGAKKSLGSPGAL